MSKNKSSNENGVIASNENGHSHAVGMEPLSRVSVKQATPIESVIRPNPVLVPEFKPADEAEQIRRLAQQPVRPPRRRSYRLWGTLVVVVLPVLCSIYYFVCVASDQYEAVADFTITSPHNLSLSLGSTSKSGLSSLLGGGGGVGSMGTMANQYIVQQYIRSRQILSDMKPALDLRKIYSNPKADWIARINPTISDEELLDYWNSMVTVDYDVLTGLSEVRVRAFTPEDSKAIADQILHLSEALVNRLSDRAQADSVASAQREVDLAKQRVLEARENLLSLSESSHQISPAGMVKSHSDIQSTLESALVDTQSQLQILRKDLPDDAPGVQQLKNRLATLQMQLSAEKLGATSSQNGGSASEIAANFSKMSMEDDFATQAYIAALGSLENVKIQGGSQSCYLEAFVNPELPQYAAYPTRLKNIILTVVICVMVWALGLLLTAAIKEHV